MSPYSLKAGHSSLWFEAQKAAGAALTIHSIRLNNVQVCEYEQNGDSVPADFYIWGTFRLYGGVEVQLTSAHSIASAGTHYIITVPGQNPLSIGALIPFLDQDPFKAIQLCAGLVLTTTLLFSGPLDFINTILVDIFNQKRDPHIEFVGLLSEHPDGASRRPQPLGFTLRGIIDEMDLKLFGFVHITRLGIDLTWIRCNSFGEYSHAYGFFGSGKIEGVDVHWHLRRYGDAYSIVIVTQSERWRALGRITGVDVDNVMLRAVWTGKASQQSLELQCTMALGLSTLVLQGHYSSGGMEVSCSLYNFSLQDLRDLYERIFKQKLDIDTSHDICFSGLSLRIATGEGVSLSGAVVVDGHTAASGFIKLSRAGITITGGIDSLTVYGVKIISPVLNVTISRSQFRVQFAGQVQVHQCRVAVDIYLNKLAGCELEYGVHGSYDGSVRIGDLISGLDDDFLNASIQKAEVYISNSDRPFPAASSALANVSQDGLQRGFSVFISASAPRIVQGLLGVRKSVPLVFLAYCNPVNCLQGQLNFAISLLLPTGELLKFDGVRCDSLALSVLVSTRGPKIQAAAKLLIDVPRRAQPLELLLALAADMEGAEGSADLTTRWVAPFGIRKLAIDSLYAKIGATYQQLVTTGLPSKVELSGHFSVSSFRGDFDMSLASNSPNVFLDLRLKNLDVIGLVKLVASVIDLEIDVGQSSQILYVHRLHIYLSTGMEYKGRYRPWGTELEARLTVFKKNVYLHGVVGKDEVVLTGMVDPFTLGFVDVSSADGKHGPFLHLAISPNQQMLIVDGKIAVLDSYVAIQLVADTKEGTLYFCFELVIFGALSATAMAWLNGDMPQILPAGADPAAIEGESLERRTFRIELDLENHIIENIIDELASRVLPNSAVHFVQSGLEAICSSVLDIRQIHVSAEAWEGVGRLTASVECRIATFAFAFSVDFYISDFYKCFREAIEPAINSICAGVRNVVTELGHKFNDFVSLLQNEILQLTEACELALNTALECVKDLPEDLLRCLHQAGVLGVDEVLQDVVECSPLYWVVDGISKQKTADEVIADAFVKPVEKVGSLLGEFGRDIVIVSPFD